MPAEVLFDNPSNSEFYKEFVQKNPSSIGIQCAAEFSEHEVNTERFDLQSTGMIHLQGGWPKEVDHTEAEAVIRYRKKIEKDEEYVRCIQTLSETASHYLKQNCCIDIYEEYFNDGQEMIESEPPSARTLTVFRDPNALKRPVSSISWSPDAARFVAVSYAILAFQRQPDNVSLSSYIWDVQNVNYPMLELAPASALCVLDYNPKDPHVVIGGCYNGLVAYWDDRKGSQPVDKCPVREAHRDPVTDVSWIQSKSGTEVSTVSTDGHMFVWDTRKFQEPFEKVVLDAKGEGMVMGATTISAEGGPSKTLVGTEQGAVLLVDRKAKSAQDRIKTVFPGHHGPIYGLHRHPFNPKYFLSIGDWTARIWADDVRTPIMSTKYHDTYLTDGCWSPTRPGVFFTTKRDGTLDVWDLHYKQNDPVFIVQVNDVGLHTLSVESQHGAMVATGGIDGSTTLLEISKGLHTSHDFKEEKKTVDETLVREFNREKNLEARAKEQRLKEKKEAAQAQKAQNVNVSDQNKYEEQLRQIEEEFFVTIAAADELQEEDQIAVPVDQ
jgi:dynein intermediate chain 2